MPRTYRMSADTNEKEKIVGGVLTLAQVVWLALGLILALLGIAGLSIFMSTTLAMFLMLPLGIGLGCLFAFKQKEGLMLFDYLMLRGKFQKKRKILLNTMTYGQSFAPRKEEER